MRPARDLGAGVLAGAISRGDHDEALRSIARTLATHQGPVLIRFAHEMNADWYPWGVVRERQHPDGLRRGLAARARRGDAVAPGLTLGLVAGGRLVAGRAAAGARSTPVTLRRLRGGQRLRARRHRPRRRSAAGTPRSATTDRNARRCSARPVPTGRTSRGWIASLVPFLGRAPRHPSGSCGSTPRPRPPVRRATTASTTPQRTSTPSAALHRSDPLHSPPVPTPLPSREPREEHHPEDQRPRHRLPRRHPRRLHGRARLRGRRRRRRRRPRSSSSTGAWCRSSSPTAAAAAQARRDRRLRFGTSLAEAAAFADVHFVCVGTPSSAAGSPPTPSYVEAVVDGAGPAPAPGALVVGKSTVPVGTAAPLRDPVLPAGPAGDRRRAGVEPGVPARGLRGRRHPAPRPARRRHGVGVGRAGAARGLRRRDRRRLPVHRHLAGDGRAGEVGRELVPGHQDLASSTPWPRCARPPAPTSSSSPTRSVTTSGSAAGSSVPGSGFGGGCLPKDIRAFQARGNELGLTKSLAFLGRGRRHQRAPPRAAPSTLAHEVLGGRIADRRMAVLGAAFKPNSDDVRDSPALDVADQLHLRGADVLVYDPAATETARAPLAAAGVRRVAGRGRAGRRPVLVLTEWAEFVALDPGWPATGCATATSSTGATCSTRRRGGPRAGTTGAWADPEDAAAGAA